MTQRDRLVVGIVLAVVGLGAFFMLVLKPKREEASRLAAQVTAAQDRVQTARADLVAGQAARATYASNYATVARLGKAVPTDDDIPSLVYQLDSTAEATGVDFRSVKLTSGAGSSAAAPANAAAAAAATSDQASAKDGESKDGEAKDPAQPTTGTPASPAAATQSATAALPPGAVVGQAGLNTMPFTFAFEGSFFKLSDFLTKIERYIKPTRESVRVRGRLLLVDGISLTAAGDGFPKMKASIAATAYLLPANQGLFDGATPQGPSAATAGQPVSAGDSAGGPPTAPATVTP
ncbi:MAG TPA: hypothetical protein VNB64_11675 [Solirubrobacteraceae bacterium]|nr:hypothetical protein [Solirubrobacteraceae bacterium]